MSKFASKYDGSRQTKFTQSKFGSAGSGGKSGTVSGGASTAGEAMGLLLALTKAS